MQPQVILITGASSGFGKITAQMLSERGHIVYGTSRKPSEDMNHVKMLVVDVTNSLSVCQAVERILSEQGRIDVLINNAGIGIGGALELATEEEVNPFLVPIQSTKRPANSIHIAYTMEKTEVIVP